MKMPFKKIFRVFAMIASSIVLLQFVVEADEIIQYTPNCLCPSKDKFPPPNSNGISQATWCGYELGQQCEIQRGYICDIEMANKEALFQTLNCLGARKYCVPFKNNPHFKACGSKMKCETIPSCTKAFNAIAIALEKLRKTYGKNATKFRMPESLR
jgi:hypothetical protein